MKRRTLAGHVRDAARYVVEHLEGRLLFAGQGWSASFQDDNSRAALTTTPEYTALWGNTINASGASDATPFPDTPASFNGGAGSTFSASWQGNVTVPSAGVWHFYPTTRDGVKLTIDGVVLFDDFDATHAAKTERDVTVKDAASVDDTAGNPVSWTAGSTHAVRMDFAHGTGTGWDAELQWAPDGNVAQKALVPTSAVSPTVPLKPFISASGGVLRGIQISWSQVDASSYLVQRSDDGGTRFSNAIPPVSASPGTATYTRAFPIANNGYSYYVRVLAVNETGTTSSDTHIVIIELDVPDSPTNVKAQPGAFVDPSHVNVAVNWDASQFAASYRVERIPVDGLGTPTGHAVSLASGITGMTYTDATAAVGARYVYRVYAAAPFGESLASANTPIVSLAQGVHEYDYTGSSDWKTGTGNAAGFKNVGTNFDVNSFRPSVDTAHDVGDNYSRLFTGKVHVSQTGDYVFATNSDDDSELTVDGKLVATLTGRGVDAYLGGTGDTGGASPSGTEVVLHLTAGQDVDFQYWQRDVSGGDYAQMKWKGTNLTGPVEPGGVAPTATLSVVPQSQFRLATGAPAAPSGLTLVSAFSHLVTLNFTDNSTNELRFRVERAKSPAGPFTLVKTVNLHDDADAGAITVTDAGMQPNNTYYYRVVAENFEGSGASALLPVQVTLEVFEGIQLFYYDDPWWGSADHSSTAAAFKNASTDGADGWITSQDLSPIDYHSDDPTHAPPAAPAGEDGRNYSVAFTGKIKTNPAQPTNATNGPETYTFVTQSDDDSYFVVNGKVVAQRVNGGPGDDTNGEQVFSISLIPNVEYNFQYYVSKDDDGGSQGFHARWIVPGDTTDYTIATGVAGYVNAPLIPFASTGGGFASPLEDGPSSPTVPAGGAFSTVSSDSLTVTWNDTTASEVGYVLERSTVSDFSSNIVTTKLPAVFSAAASGGAGGLGSAKITGLSPGTQFFFRLRAENYDVSSANVNLGSVTTATLATPANIVGNWNPTTNTMVITWTDPAPAGTKVSVQRSVNNGAFAEIAQVNAGVGTYTDTTATFPTFSYTYRLQSLQLPGTASSGYGVVAFSPVVYPASKPVNYGTGFDGSGTPNTLYDGTSMDLQLNANIAASAAGVPKVSSNVLTLTSLNNDEAASVYGTEKVNVVGNWVTSFDFQVTGAVADGFVFVLQNRDGVDAERYVGGGGGGVGYDGIGAKAAAIVFDTYNAHSSTGLFLGDTSPGGNDELNDPATLGLQNHGIDLNPGGTGIDLHAGHNLRAVITHDGTTGIMTEEVIDLDDANRRIFNYNYGATNLIAQLGGSFAYVGFAGATGGSNERVDVKNWVFASVHGDPPTGTLTVGDGTAQRSQLKNVTLTVGQPVDLAAGALKLTALATNAAGVADPDPSHGVNASAALGTPTSPDGGLTWIWTVVGGTAWSQTNSRGAFTGSLVDGVYQATLDHTKVTAGGGVVQLQSDTTITFHRLFGDNNGNKTVNNQDYGQFRNAFLKPGGDPTYVAAFDFDNSGVVNNLDYGQFRTRFLKVFNY